MGLKVPRVPFSILIGIEENTHSKFARREPFIDPFLLGDGEGSFYFISFQELDNGVLG